MLDAKFRHGIFYNVLVFLPSNTEQFWNLKIFSCASERKPATKPHDVILGVI
jgi:hypothetical protein